MKGGCSRGGRGREESICGTQFVDLLPRDVVMTSVGRHRHQEHGGGKLFGGLCVMCSALLRWPLFLPEDCMRM